MTLSAAYTRLRETLEGLAKDPLSHGKCSKCGEWCGGVLMCDCERASWEPIEVQDLAAKVLREMAAMQSEGIPVLRLKDAPEEFRPTCGTCGQSFDLQDPEQVAYHDQERHEPREDDAK